MLSAFIEIGIIFFLILCNGFFSMLEVAVISSRKNRLKQDIAQGDPNAQKALDLVQEPTRLLSTTQIGITSIGVLTGTFGGATLIQSLQNFLLLFELTQSFANSIAIGIVVGSITIFTLVLGEIIPKRIGMAYPEAIAKRFSKKMQQLAWMAHPLVSLLSFVSEGIIKLFKIPHIDSTQQLNENDVKMIVRESEASGVLAKNESAMVEAVLDLDATRVKELMVTRAEIEWISTDLALEEILNIVCSSAHTYFPVHEGRRDNTLGILSLKDLFQAYRINSNFDLKSILKSPLIVPETQLVTSLLDTFHQHEITFALVADEFGGISGLITLYDIMEYIVHHNIDLEDQSVILERPDGSLLIDAMIKLDLLTQFLPEFKNVLNDELEATTLNGWIIQYLGHIPQAGYQLSLPAFNLEIIDIDSNHIDKVLLIKK